MKILVTGAKGMVGTALVNNLKNIRDNKNRTRPNISIEEIYEGYEDIILTKSKKYGNTTVCYYRVDSELE